MNKTVAEGELESDVEQIGAAMSRMRLLTGRRYIGRLAISRVGAGMELSHLDVLTLVRRLGARQEVTVGAIAENMGIDHSRASRIIAELVKRGVLRREASQQDARRTVVALTEAGVAWLGKVRDVKQEVLDALLKGWSPEEIRVFGRLYDRFTQALEDQAAAFDARDGAGEREKD